MPRLSATSLLNRAIDAAVNDRVSLADCYSDPDAPMRAQALQEAKDFRALEGRKFQTLSPDELKTAFSLFVYAEQWEEGLVEANHGKGEAAAEALRTFRMYRKFRLATWGRSQLEAAVADATLVGLDELRKRTTLAD